MADTKEIPPELVRAAPSPVFPEGQGQTSGQGQALDQGQTSSQGHPPAPEPQPGQGQIPSQGYQQGQAYQPNQGQGYQQGQPGYAQGQPVYQQGQAGYYQGQAYQHGPQQQQGYVQVPPQGYAPPPQAFVPPGGVVIAQPITIQQKDWSTGLCDCFSDLESCCTVMWCGTPVFDAFLAGRFDENVCGPVLTWDWGLFMPTMLLRMRLRHNQKIQGSLFCDFCASMCCLPCAQCQLQREMKFIEMKTPGQLPEYRKFMP